MNKIRLRRDPIREIDGIPVFTTPDRYTDNYDQIARDHLAHSADGNENPFIDEIDWTILEEATARVLRSVAKPGMSVLDLGVGTGRLIQMFPELDRSGVDISLDYLRLLPAKNIKPYMARAEDLPFADDSFDLVVSTDVLEHVIDLHATIKEIYRILKPGGHLIIRVPYREKLAPYLSPVQPYDLVHLRNFDEDGLQLLLGRVYGFEPNGDKYTYIMAGSWFRWQRPAIVRQLMGRIVRPLAARSRVLYERLSRILYRPFAITTHYRKPDNKDS